jgi:hypothetical protein
MSDRRDILIAGGVLGAAYWWLSRKSATAQPTAASTSTLAQNIAKLGASKTLGGAKTIGPLGGAGGSALTEGVANAPAGTQGIDVGVRYVKQPSIIFSNGGQATYIPTGTGYAIFGNTVTGDFFARGPANDVYQWNQVLLGLAGTETLQELATAQNADVAAYYDALGNSQFPGADAISVYGAGVLAFPATFADGALASYEMVFPGNQNPPQLATLVNNYCTEIQEITLMVNALFTASNGVQGPGGVSANNPISQALNFGIQEDESAIKAA